MIYWYSFGNSDLRKGVNLNSKLVRLLWNVNPDFKIIFIGFVHTKIMSIRVTWAPFKSGELLSSVKSDYFFIRFFVAYFIVAII
jgi:hypothetical protein